MNADSLFSLAGILVLPGWLLLIFLPRWQYSTLVAGFVIPLLPATAYAGH